jgi:hypothetical protein
LEVIEPSKLFEQLLAVIVSSKFLYFFLLQKAISWLITLQVTSYLYQDKCNALPHAICGYQLSVCFVAAELVLPAGSNLSKLFYDCKDYILSIYQDDISKEKLDEICKVL